VAAHYHTVPLVGLLIGPVTVLFASVALIAGFLVFFLALVCPPLVLAAGWLVTVCLAGCEFLVDAGMNARGSYFFVPDIPQWWLWLFFPGLLAVLMLNPLYRRWRWALLVGLAWLCIGLLSGWTKPAPKELRCTFLAVGHGGCTVLETPDGRTLLYDAGAIGGPDVTRRQIAPYLWSRGIRRIDEIFLSHADLDHFNGLIDLLDRFAVGQVSCTPSFSRKPLEAVRLTLAALKRRGVPVRTIHAGDRLAAGEVTLEVLHPPKIGPEGNENARSLVLLVRHADHTILLTGDLEGPGMQRVVGLPPPRVDVLMAPHHGSRTANTPALAEKVKPRMVISCQGPPRGATRPPDPNMVPGVPFLGTWPEGAVTVRSKEGNLMVETFLTRQRFVLGKRR
jgi:competence protein ComEC